MIAPDKNLMERDRPPRYMNYRNILRPARGAQLMVQLAREHGLTLDQSLKGSGITPDLLENAAAEIRMDQEIVLTRNIVTALKHVPALGVEAGLRYTLSTFGVYGFAIL